MIIGLTGQKLSGKDTFAQMLIEKFPVFTRLAFADGLKQLCSKVFGIDIRLLNDSYLKDIYLDDKIYPDKYLKNLQRLTKLKLQTTEVTARTPRELLQLVGTNYIRKASENFWIQKMEKTLLTTLKKNLVVITDVRFQNEAELIHRHGGKVLRIVRLSQTVNNDTHESENQKITYDYILAVMEDNFEWTRRLLNSASAVYPTRSRRKYLDACFFDVEGNIKIHSLERLLENLKNATDNRQSFSLFRQVNELKLRDARFYYGDFLSAMESVKERQVETLEV